MWLFSDMLVYGTRNVLGSKYHPHGVFRLDGITLEENPAVLAKREIRTSFALHGYKKPLYFYCSNAEETVAWRRNIQETIRELHHQSVSNARSEGDGGEETTARKTGTDCRCMP
eukprot:gb/GECG01004765.1/.p1 GENE.gb/GECG01004765.1/~~gb/GECG01004765.1/.p1  ORF type:complete len:114 (+),score=13.79 gb/GECG01004765.1/:1-342(+)